MKFEDQVIAPSCTNGVITLNPKKKDGTQTYQHDRIYDCEGKFTTLQSGMSNRNWIKDPYGNIRKLSIREQARLQNVPENYSFDAISISEASKCLGNGWTIDVISHIFNKLKKLKYDNMKEGINALSLFDGMSCGQIALNRSGFKINEYYASEIDKHAIKVTMANYPNTIQLGSVIHIDDMVLPYIHLLIGGSPCQSFSFAGTMKGMSTKDNIEILSLEQYLDLKDLGFEFEGQSYLFWEYVRILKLVRETNPNVKFLLENVKMVKKWEDLISDVLGVRPLKINSALVSAQNRQRLYWTNIEGVEMPEDKGILLKDIVHEHCLTDRDKSHAIIASVGRTTQREYFKKGQGQMVLDCTPTFNIHPSGSGMNGIVRSVNNEKANTLTTNKGEGQKISIPLYEFIVPFDKTLQILDKEVARGKVGYFRKDSQANRVYYIHDKAVTLCEETGGGAAKMGQYLFGCITPDRINKSQNGQRFNEGQKFYTLTDQDQHGILIEGYIRKLTPVECERLQTVEDDYTSAVSNSQRYRMLGNGWTVDVISHILSSWKPS